MRSSSRINIAGIAAMMAIASSASATEKSITPMSPSFDNTFWIAKAPSNSANKKAPGANKAAQRAAMKLRRIKAHKARIK